MPITIQLLDLKSQTSLNLSRWAELLADAELARLPNRVETDRHGHILMSPPPAFTHADRQGQIADLLKSLLPEGRALPKCPVSTADGVKVVDIVWLAPGRPELVERPILLTTAPEICIEVLFPSNTLAEIDEKRASISTPAQPKSGFATWIDPSVFLLVPITKILPLSSVPPFPTGSVDRAKGAAEFHPWR